MRRHDSWTGFFWLVFACFICFQSLKLGIGSLRNPGMGFILLGSSVLLGILSIFLLIRSILSRETIDVSEKALFAGTMWKRVVFILFMLIMYAKIMPWAGYLLSTFILMSILFWVVQKKTWYWPLIMSLMTTFTTYYLFSVLLKGAFPRGFLGF